MTLYSETFGSGDDVVFLHGWGFNSAVWHKVVSGLSQNYRVTVIDLPGFGQSADVKCDYQLDSLVGLLINVIPEKATLLGWSMGGLIAQGIALQYPQHLKKMILLGSNAKFMADDEWPHAMKQHLLDGFIDELITNFKRTLQVFLMLQAQGGDHVKETIRELKEKLYLHGEPDEAALRGGLLLLKNTNLAPRLSSIEIPVHLFYGRLDTLVPLAAAKVMEEEIPNAQLHVFQQSSHAPFISHYDEFMLVLNKALVS